MTGRLEFSPPDDDGTITITRNGEELGIITAKKKDGYHRGNHDLYTGQRGDPEPHRTIGEAKQAARQRLGD